MLAPDIQLVDHPLSAASFTAFPADAGAECVFVGRTRAETHPTHGALRRLHYDAYPAMAVCELETLARTAETRFGAMAIRLHHALGPVAVGEASVVVQVACAHRADAFEVCRFLIDALKQRVPIWKREEWADGTTWSRGTPVGDATDALSVSDARAAGSAGGIAGGIAAAD